MIGDYGAPSGIAVVLLGTTAATLAALGVAAALGIGVARLLVRYTTG